MSVTLFTSQTSIWPNVSIHPETTHLSNSSHSCSDFKYFAYTVTYSLVFPFGFISNSAALFVFLFLIPKKTANTVFMTNLAVSDVGFSLTLPFRLAYYFQGCEWLYPDWLCRLCVFSFYLNLYTSVLFLTGLSVLRYLAVLKPFRNKTLVTVRRASLICLAIWVFVAALSSPFLMTGTLIRQGKTRCFEPGSKSSWRRILFLNYVGLTLGFLLPFVTILVCYGRIIRRLLHRHKMGSRKRRNRQRTVYLIIVVLSTFLLSFLPYHVARTVHLHATVANRNSPFTLRMLKVLVVTLCLAASNSCLNPLLYYFAGESFRTAIRKASERKSFSSINHGSLILPLYERNRTNSQLVPRTYLDPQPHTVQPLSPKGQHEQGTSGAVKGPK
ncbi:cysteinyl leukotriene receptor 2 [Chanos chanos]|uniref:Cysteinyl leukotriene receptor 2 n=1 Tax=Chanos chanos TaxID=29144 RepID=A0A6J2VRE8_CHACN|nr:cysteinyl leukotriene receptor 2-like [Chanos chanos]